MDWSIVGREAKRVVKDVIDQSFGTHFFSSNSQTNSQTKPVESPVQSDPAKQGTPPVPNPEEVKIKEAEQKAKAELVRAELDAAISAQRQKRLAEQQQIEQIRLESLAKAGPQNIEQHDLQKDAGYIQPTSEQFDAKTKE